MKHEWLWKLIERVRGIRCRWKSHQWITTQPWCGQLNGRSAFMAPFTYCKQCGKLQPK